MENLEIVSLLCEHFTSDHYKLTWIIVIIELSFVTGQKNIERIIDTQGFNERDNFLSRC